MNKIMKIKKSYFSGECAIVTGASSGIGREISKILVRDYGMVVFGCARNLERLNETKKYVEEGSQSNGCFIPYPLDVTHADEIQHLRDHINRNTYNLRLVVSNAGQMTPFMCFSHTRMSEAEKLVDVNLLGSMNLANAFLPDFEKSPRKVGFVFVGSLAGLVPIPGSSVYSASKGGVKQFAESLVAENTNKKIYIGLMMPGMTNTNLFANAGINLPDWIKKLMTPADKMAKKIVDCARKRKRRVVLGADAKLMKFCYTLSPKGFPRTMRRILRKFGILQ